MIEVAIQGIKGSYHDIASSKFFGEREQIVPIECETFPELFKKLETRPAAYGLIAIENTLAGTLLPNYGLLRASDFQIIGEVYLRIEHCLLGLNGTGVEQLREVYSHPMAILQCLDYFDSYPSIKLIESADTALSAKWLKETTTIGAGVIASQAAAEYYGLNILDRGIETNQRNFTRFLVLGHGSEININPEDVNKASLCFKLPHQAGSLAKVLTTLSESGINLTKIQSIPVVGQEWEYFFLLDVEFEHFEMYEQTIQSIQKDCLQIEVLGIYKTGNKHRTL